MRINETWEIPSGKLDGDYVGLLENKKMFILSCRGNNERALLEIILVKHSTNPNDIILKA